MGSTSRVQSAGFRGKSNLLAPLPIALAAFLVYFFTLSPSINFGDSPELIAGAYTLGIPHPPGYPLYCLMGKLFAFLPFGEEVAWRLNLASALYSAAGIYLLGFVAVRIQGDGRPLSLAATLVPFLFLVFSPTLWSQSVISEVYALNFLFFSLLVLIALRWRENKQKRLLLAFSFLYGLGLANHHTLVAIGPLFCCLVLLEDRKIFTDVKLLVLILALFLLGLSVYLYLPLRSLQSPPMDWGDPQTLDRFLDVVLRRQFRTVDQGYSLERILSQAATFGKTVFVEFPLPTVLLALAGFAGFLAAGAGPFLFLLGLFAVHGIGTIVFLNPAGESFEYVNVMMIPAYALLGLAAAYGAGRLEALVSGKGTRPAVSALVIFLLIVCAIYQGSATIGAASQRNNYFARDYGYNTLQSIEPDGVIFVESDTFLFPLWYHQFVEGRRPDVAVIDVDFLMLPWFKGQLKERYKNLDIKVEDLGKHSSGSRSGGSIGDMIDIYKVQQMEVIVDSVIDSRPIYVSYEFGPVYSQYRQKRDLLPNNHGLLYKISGRYEPPSPETWFRYELRSLLDYPVRDDPYFFALSMAYMNALKSRADMLIRSGKSAEGARILARTDEIRARSRDFLKKRGPYLSR